VSDVESKMFELRDQRKLAIPDGHIKVAARDEGGSVAALTKLFRTRGTALSAGLVAQLAELRADAVRALSAGDATASGETVITDAPSSPRPDDAVARVRNADHEVVEPVQFRRGWSQLADADLPDPALVSTDIDAFHVTEHRIRIVNDDRRTILFWPAGEDGPDRTTAYLVCASDVQVPDRPDEGKPLVVTLRNQTMVTSNEAFGPYFAVFAYDITGPDELRTAIGRRHAYGRELKEVQDLQVVPEQHGVHFTWRLPKGIERVRVLRSAAGQPLPSGPSPNARLVTATPYRDTDVEAGATYTYRIYTESVAIGASGGTPEFSTGLVRTVEIPGTPDPVTAVAAACSKRGNQLGFVASWQRPLRGHVRLYLAPGDPNAEVVLGDPQTAAQFELQVTMLGRRLDEPIHTEGDTDRVEWVPLPAQPAGAGISRWTLTVVTELVDTLVIGCQKVLVHVGDVEELILDERIDWQLLRSTWPTGASILGVWRLPVGTGASGPPHQTVTREEFERHGGVPMRLGPTPQRIALQGAIWYGRQYQPGKLAYVDYPGRWVVRYELVPTGKFGSSHQLRIGVERPGLADLSFRLVAAPQFPMTVTAPGITELQAGQLPGQALVPGSFVAAGPELKVPRGATTRLLARSSSGQKLFVIDPTDPSQRPPQPPPAPAMRCPRCLQPSDLSLQFFRCEGDCAPVPDLPATYLLHPASGHYEQPVMGKPVFQVARQVIRQGNREQLGPPINSAICAQCSKQSRSHVCPHCHFALPPNWWSNEVGGLVVVGARSSGKTTYLSVVVRHIENILLPAIGGHLHPLEPESEAKLNELRSGLQRGGRLPEGTRGVRANEKLLRPMMASIGNSPSGRHRVLALFDVAGEDMAHAETVRPYLPALSRADAVVLLIDPLQLDGVRDWLHGSYPLPEPSAVGVPAVNVLSNITQELRGYLGIPTGQLPIPLAVTFSKFDGLEEAAGVPQSHVSGLIGPGNALWRDPYPMQSALYLAGDGRRVHDEVRGLLLAMGESALVSAAERSFAEVQYFALSALGHGPRGRIMTSAGASPQRVGDPLRWLLWRLGWGQ
jgi:hypothetical protein